MTKTVKKLGREARSVVLLLEAITEAVAEAFAEAFAKAFAESSIGSR
jgi:hypothetical protein